MFVICGIYSSGDSNRNSPLPFLYVYLTNPNSMLIWWMLMRKVIRMCRYRCIKLFFSYFCWRKRMEIENQGKYRCLIACQCLSKIMQPPWIVSTNIFFFFCEHTLWRNRFTLLGKNRTIYNIFSTYMIWTECRVRAYGIGEGQYYHFTTLGYQI